MFVSPFVLRSVCLFCFLTKDDFFSPFLKLWLFQNAEDESSGCVDAAAGSYALGQGADLQRGSCKGVCAHSLCVLFLRACPERQTHVLLMTLDGAITLPSLGRGPHPESWP